MMKRRTFLGIPIGAAATYIFRPDKDDKLLANQLVSFSYTTDRFDIPMQRGELSLIDDKVTATGELRLKDGATLTFKMSDLCWSVK